MIFVPFPEKVNCKTVNGFKVEMVKTIEKSVPHWESLCDKGHQYLFSDDALNWNDANEMCKLLGGYLVKIESRHENNCLLVYAMNNGLQNEWWRTSGIY